MTRSSAVAIFVVLLAWGTSVRAQSLADAPTRARSAKTGQYISWREHVIDDSALAGTQLLGADGACAADLDGDGHLDIVTVHEDNNHVRIAFGTDSPSSWRNITLASGTLVGQAEDVDVGDLNRDGRLDIVVACEAARVVCFLAGPNRRTREDWTAVVLSQSENRGSWIRVKCADVDGDGQLEIFAANKGGTAFSCFHLNGVADDGRAWREQVIGTAARPINVRPLDVDGDGDLDVVAGSRGESRIFILENLDQGRRWEQHLIYDASDVPSEGFMFAFADLDKDGRLDVITVSKPATGGGNGSVFWLRQPESLSGQWRRFMIGSLAPDEPTGIALADINDDGRLDLITGGYSRGPRLEEPENPPVAQSSGRLAWFAQPADPATAWTLYNISRRCRGMFDVFIPVDLNGDGYQDFISTRGNSGEFDGTIWLEQVRSDAPIASFHRARESDSVELPLP